LTLKENTILSSFTLYIL